MVKRAPIPNLSLAQSVMLLLQSQAELLHSHSTFMTTSSERFARIEERMNSIELLLMKLLEILPEALRDRIGISRTHPK